MGVQWHAPYEKLSPETRDMARALNSLQEELEAMDWYNQRVDVTHDDELRGILAHNRDEEKEHAAMLLEWIRRKDPVWDAHLRTYLFTENDILEQEEAAKTDEAPASKGEADSSAKPGKRGTGPGLTVGSLRPTRKDR
jgi:ferritin-like protein